MAASQAAAGIATASPGVSVAANQAAAGTAMGAPGASLAVSSTPPTAEQQLHAIWVEATKAFQDTLSPTEYRRLQSVGSFGRLMKEVADLATAYDKRRVPKLLARVEPLFERLEFFSRTISIFVQSNPEISALIWGSVFALLEMAVQHQKDLESIAQILEFVSKHMPRITSLIDLVVVSDRIQKALCGLYRDLIQFFFQAIMYLKRNPIRNVFKITWPCSRKPKFKDQFASVSKSIREHTEWIDVEVSVGLHIKTHELTVHGRDEILSRISLLASPQTLPSPAAVQHRMIPYVANPQFFSRTAELSRLSSLLIPNQAGLLIISIIGEGGIGKTQLALQFAYKHFADYTAIFWARADSTLSLAQSYENIALEIGLTQSSRGSGSLDITRERVLKWFRTTDHSWLLVFDNVKSMDHLENYWPAGSHGSIILTTRDQRLTQPPISNALRLRCFSEEEGIQFILEHFPSRPESSADRTEHAREICKSCGGLPLALSQVIRYASALHMPIGEVRTICSSPASFLDPNSELSTLNRTDFYHPVGTSALWRQTIQSLGPACSTLARFLAHLNPDAIPGDLLGIKSSPRFQAQFGPAVANENLLQLLSHSLLSGGTATHDYKMHRLIQAAILRELTPEQTADAFALALEIINAAFPEYDDNDRLVDSWQRCTEILPHVVRLSDIFSSSSPYTLHTYLQLGQLLERAAYYLIERSSWGDCGPLLELASTVTQAGLQKAQSRVPPTDAGLIREFIKLVSDIENTLAKTKMQSGNFDQALQLYLSAVTTRSTLNELDNELIYIRRNVVYAYLCLGRPQEAIVMLAELGDLADQQFAADRNLLVYRNNHANTQGLLCFAHLILGQFGEARAAAEKSTELAKSFLSAESVILADCYQALSEIRKCQNDLDEAETLILKALDMRTTADGSSAETAVTLHAYATVLKEKGAEEAQSVMARAVEMLRKAPGSELFLARSLFYLGKYQQEQGQSSGIAATEEALQIYEAHVGVTRAKDRSAVSGADFEALIPCERRAYSILHRNT